MDKPIEIRTWPQRTNVVVVDVARATPIAEYPIKPQHADGAVFNPLGSYQDRADHAVRLLESDQEFLRHAFLEETDEIRLQIIPGSRTFIDQVLDKHNLQVRDLDIERTCDLIKTLDEMPLRNLFELLVDWFDVVERHRDFGASEKNRPPWIQRSQPDNCYLFHYLNDGSQYKPERSDPEAFSLMMMTLDVSDDDYTFGHLLRWVYYTRAEFGSLPRKHLNAWRNLSA